MVVVEEICLSIDFRVHQYSDHVLLLMLGISPCPSSTAVISC